MSKAIISEIKGLWRGYRLQRKADRLIRERIELLTMKGKI